MQPYYVMYMILVPLRVVKAGYRNLQIGSWQLYGMYNVACLHVQFTSYACICMYNIIQLLLTRWYMHVLYFRQEIGVLEKVLCAAGKTHPK